MLQGHRRRTLSQHALRQPLRQNRAFLDTGVKVGTRRALVSGDNTASQLSADWVLAIFTGGA